MAELIDIKTIVDLLTQRIEAVAAEVLPRGHREGHDWVEASTARGGIGDSLRVCISGARAGTWAHFAANNDKKGDPLELISYVLFDGDKRKAIAWAKSYLGLDGADPARIKQARLRAAAARKDAAEQEKKQRAETQKYVKALWLRAEANIINTAVDYYLRGRGIDIRHLAHFPRALRFARDLKHKNGNYYPAMIAAIVNNAGEHVAVHRTYLQQADNFGVVKADLGDGAKMVLGSYAGGYIPISRGASGKSLRDAPAGDRVILCEGIEDGLTLALAQPDARVLAAISVNNFKNIILPDTVCTVVVAADNDDEGSAAANALEDAVQGFIDQGRDVYVVRARGAKDFNDMLRGQA